MAAVFPLDTTKPWFFNDTTYEYDANEDRWYVVSTNATDTVVQEFSSLELEQAAQDNRLNLIEDENLDQTNRIDAIETDITLKADKTYVNAQDALKADITYVDSQDALKADKTYVDSQDSLKADKTYVDSQDALKADKTYVDSQDSLKADKTYVDTQDALKADKTYVDGNYLKLSGGSLTGNLNSNSLFKCTRNTGYAFEVKPNDSDTIAFIHTDGRFKSKRLVVAPDFTVDTRSFEIRGELSNGTTDSANFFYGYINNAGTADAVNYSGKTSSNTNIQNKESVDAAIAAAITSPVITGLQLKDATCVSNIPGENQFAGYYTAGSGSSANPYPGNWNQWIEIYNVSGKGATDFTSENTFDEDKMCEIWSKAGGRMFFKAVVDRGYIAGNHYRISLKKVLFGTGFTGDTGTDGLGRTDGNFVIVY